MTHRYNFWLILLLLTLLTFMVAIFGSASVRSANEATATPISKPTLPVYIPTGASEGDSSLITISEALEHVEDNCILPCFFGFTPNETTSRELVAYLEVNELDAIQRQYLELYPTLEAYLRDGQPIGFSFLSDNHEMRGGFAVQFGIDAEFLRIIRVQFVRPDLWLTRNTDWVDLPSILSQIPSTPDVYIFGTSTAIDYFIYLIYREEGMQFEYHFDLSQDNSLDRPVEQLCLNIERTTQIKMLLNVSEAAFIDVDQLKPQSPLDPYALHTVEEWLGIKTEEFVQFFIDHPRWLLKCLC